MKSQKHPSDQRVTPPRFTLIKSIACGLALLASGQAMAATYTLTDFGTLTGTAPLTGTFTNVGSSTVDVTVNATKGQRFTGTSPNVISVPLNANTPQTSDLTISFSKAVTNVKLSVAAVGYNAGANGVDEYLHTFKVNGTTLTTLPAVATYGSNVLLTSVTAAGGSGVAPAATPAYAGGPTDNGGGILTFPGAAITSVGFTTQTEATTPTPEIIGVQVISFDYTPTTTSVSAPIFSTKEKPAVFSEEVK